MVSTSREHQTAAAPSDTSIEGVYQSIEFLVERHMRLITSWRISIIIYIYNKISIIYKIFIKLNKILHSEEEN